MAVQVTFRNTHKYKHDKELFIAPEGVFSGQVRRGKERACKAEWRAMHDACDRRTALQGWGAGVWCLAAGTDVW